MGYRAPARLAVPLVRAGTGRAGAGRAFGARDREPATAAWQGLPLQSGGGVRASGAGGSGLRARDHRPRHDRAHPADPRASPGRPRGGATRRGVAGGARPGRTARARPRGARGGRGRFGDRRLPGVHRRRRRLCRGPVRAGPHLLLGAASGGRLACLLRRGPRRRLGGRVRDVPPRLGLRRRHRRARGVRWAAGAGRPRGVAGALLGAPRRGGGA